MDTQQRSLLNFLRFFTAVVMVAIMYFAREVLVPLALAALFAFLLNPLVKFLCKWRLPRVVSVVIVTMLVFTALGLVSWMVGKELHHLANELPSYRHNIQERVAAVRSASEGGTISRLRQMVADISTSALDASAGRQSAVKPTPPVTPENNAPPQPQAPPPVEGGMASSILNSTLASLANGLGVAAVVILFVIFMLLRQQDISHRVVSLVGFSRLTTTTKAIDEIGERISKYLLMLATVNTLYGILLAIGLAFIGLPYVLLWGVLAALFRFIPYIGPWIVAVLPASLSLAVFDGWMQPLMVISLIVTLELVTNMILEPLLYGQSVGVSDLALLVAITFWTWLWGGIGLVLATPLTVCLVVLCKYIPSLAWVDVLMGEKQAPQLHLTSFQRLIAGDEDSFQTIVRDSVKERGVIETLDEIALPALVLTRRETVVGKLDVEEQQDAYEALQTTTYYLKECRDEEIEETEKEEAKAAEKAAEDKAEADEKAAKEGQLPTDARSDADLEAEVAEEEPNPATVTIVARALNGQADSQALEMLDILLPEHVTMKVSADQRLIGELVANLEESKPTLLVLSAMRPGSLTAAETLCRRLHHKLPNMKILVCRWGLPGQQVTSKSLKEAGASWVVSSLKEACNVIEEATVQKA